MSPFIAGGSVPLDAFARHKGLVAHAQICRIKVYRSLYRFDGQDDVIEGLDGEW